MATTTEDTRRPVQMVPVVYFPAVPGEPPTPVPYVMTEAELARFIQLVSDRPYQAILRYRNKGQLRAVQVGKNLRYLLPDAIRFLELAQDENPR